MKPFHDRTSARQIELCLVSHGPDPLAGYNREIARWLFRFGAVRVLSDQPRPAHLPQDVRWSEFPSETTRTENWNRAVEESSHSWTLILEQGEHLHPESFDLNLPLDPGSWPLARICWRREGDVTRIYQQNRLIPGGWSAPFDGMDLPDVSRTLREHSILAGDRVLELDRETHPWQDVRSHPDRPGEEDTPSWKLAMGEYFLDEGQPVVAAGYFRTLLKRSELSMGDRLSALNGLASSYAEQHRWREALDLTDQSISQTSRQWLPHLIRYRLLDLSGEKGAARQALEMYALAMEKDSRASMDRRLSWSELVRRQIRLDVAMGDLARALDGLDRLAEQLEGEAYHEIVLRAIRVALQARDRERAGSYLNRLKGELEKAEPSAERLEELELLMEGMSDEGWYDLLLPVYESLQTQYPENELYRRRLIVALSRTGHLKRAQAMMRGVS